MDLQPPGGLYLPGGEGLFDQGRPEDGPPCSSKALHVSMLRRLTRGGLSVGAAVTLVEL